MPRPRSLMTAQIILFVCSGLTCTSMQAFYQQAPSTQASNAFEDYFYGPNAQYIGSDKGWPAYEKLSESIGTMTPNEIAAGISVIDSQLDSTFGLQTPFAKPQAIYLLRNIAFRKDGPELIASQMERLTSMLNDPAHLLSAPALMVLQMIGYKRPDVAWPILEAALEGPEVNNKTGIGPGIAVTLLFMGPHGDDVTKHVAQYMRRPDLTDSQLLSTIIGINNSPVIPDILTAELVRSLDRPNEQIKNRALVGISRSSPAAKDMAKMRIQQLANDPRETPHAKRLAMEALEKQITEDPDSDK